MDRLTAMQAFVTVAELRGFAPAARRLRVSAPTVTRLVAFLEQTLAIELLKRTTRSVALTDAGARYLERARRILAEVSEAEATARAELTVPTGRLVITAPNAFGRREVAPLLCDFLWRHPGVQAELVLSDAAASFVEEGIDLAVRIGHLRDSGLRARIVGATRRVLVASPEYLAQHPRVRAPRDLTKHALIQFTALTPLPEWRFFRRGVEEPVHITPRLSTNSADAAVEFAARHGGIAMVLAYQARTLIREGTLAIVLPQHEPPPMPIQLVTSGTRLLSASVRAFLELAADTRDWDFVDL